MNDYWIMISPCILDRKLDCRFGLIYWSLLTRNVLQSLMDIAYWKTKPFSIAFWNDLCPSRMTEPNSPRTSLIINLGLAWMKLVKDFSKCLGRSLFLTDSESINWQGLRSQGVSSWRQCSARSLIWIQENIAFRSRSPSDIFLKRGIIWLRAPPFSPMTMPNRAMITRALF